MFILSSLFLRALCHLSLFPLTLVPNTLLYLYIPALSTYLSTCLCSHATACYFNANFMAMFWKCCTQELIWPSHISHIAFCWLVSVTISGNVQQGQPLIRTKGQDTNEQTSQGCMRRLLIWKRPSWQLCRLLSSPAWLFINQILRIKT